MALLELIFVQNGLLSFVLVLGFAYVNSFIIASCVYLMYEFITNTRNSDVTVSSRSVSASDGVNVDMFCSTVTHNSSLPPVPGLEPVELPPSSQSSATELSSSADENRSVTYVFEALLYSG